MSALSPVSIWIRVLRGLLTRSIDWVGDQSTLDDLNRWLVSRQIDVAARQRRLTAERVNWPRWTSADGRDQLRPIIWSRRPPWAHAGDAPVAIPGMLTEEETRYYEWLGRFYSGAGAAIEIGCWLGHSTWHIVAGLLRNPSFAGRRLHVFDAFVWQAYMNAFLPDAHPAAGASFRALFDHHTSPIRAHLDVATCTLVPGYGDGTVPLFSWHGGPIELCWVDCGKSHEANEAWFTTVSPSFLSDRTLIVLQDWGNHRTGTSPADTGIKAFTDAHAANLELVHELRQGAVGTFLFRRPT